MESLLRIGILFYLKYLKLVVEIFVPLTIKFAVKLTVVAEFDDWHV